MTRYIDVEFGVHNRSSPQLGYWLEISDSRDGRVILDTDRHPVTGQLLLTAEECLNVVMLYALDDEPKKG